MLIELLIRIYFKDCFIPESYFLFLRKIIRVKRGDILQLRITDFAFGGKGIAKLEINDAIYPVFVENTFPGQLVEARVAKKRKKYAECKLLKVIERSEMEVECSYQAISGAPYINVPIEIQREYKQRSTIDVYRRLGQFHQANDLFDGYIESPNHYNYRNKMEYSFSTIRQDLETGEELDDQFALGFKTRGTWWKVENLDKEDGLFDAEFEVLLKPIRQFLEKTGLPAWHPPQKIGFSAI